MPVQSRSKYAFEQDALVVCANASPHRSVQSTAPPRRIHTVSSKTDGVGRWASDCWHADARCMSGAAAAAGPGSSPPQGDSDDMENELKQRLLQQALKHVNTEGWTTRAIHAAAKDLNFSPALSGVCKSEADLVEYFIRQCNNAVFDKIADERPLWASSSPTDRLKLAVRWRLEMLEPYIGSWPQAMAVLAAPQNASTAISLMYELIDGIWAAVGDQASDRSWYTKRLSLQVVYTATELYLLTDKSEGHADTWAALDRRLEDVEAFGSGVYTAEMKLMELVNRVRTFGQ